MYLDRVVEQKNIREGKKLLRTFEKILSDRISELELLELQSFSVGTLRSLKEQKTLNEFLHNLLFKNMQ